MGLILDGVPIRVVFRYQHSAYGKDETRMLQSIKHAAWKARGFQAVEESAQRIAESRPPNVTECFIVPDTTKINFSDRPGDIAGLIAYGRVFHNVKDRYNRERGRKAAFRSAVVQHFAAPAVKAQFFSWFTLRRRLAQVESQHGASPIIVELDSAMPWPGHKRSGKG